jgi:hypothetical protein
MTKVEEWFSVPWLIIFIWMMVWTPKTRRGWYVALFVIACQLAVLFFVFVHF